MVGAPRKSPESGRRTTSKRCKRAGDIHSAIELHTSNAFLVSANHQGLSGSKKYDKEAEEEWSKFHRGGEGSTAPRPRPSGLQISNSKLTAWETLIWGSTVHSPRGWLYSWTPSTLPVSHFLTPIRFIYLYPLSHIPSTCDMSEPPGSMLQSLFEAALHNYEEQTGMKLIDHPLARQLENCNSVESITEVLQEQARAFTEF